MHEKPQRDSELFGPSDISFHRITFAQEPRHVNFFAFNVQHSKFPRSLELSTDQQVVPVNLLTMDLQHCVTVLKISF